MENPEWTKARQALSAITPEKSEATSSFSAPACYGYGYGIQATASANQSSSFNPYTAGYGESQQNQQPSPWGNYYNAQYNYGSSQPNRIGNPGASGVRFSIPSRRPMAPQNFRQFTNKDSTTSGSGPTLSAGGGVTAPPPPPPPPPPPSVSTSVNPTASNAIVSQPPQTTSNGSTPKVVDQWPMDLKSYVSRCFSKCRTNGDKDFIEGELRKKITEVHKTKNFSSVDWANEPLILPPSTQVPVATPMGFTHNGVRQSRWDESNSQQGGRDRGFSKGRGADEKLASPLGAGRGFDMHGEGRQGRFNFRRGGRGRGGRSDQRPVLGGFSRDAARKDASSDSYSSSSSTSSSRSRSRRRSGRRRSYSRSPSWGKRRRTNGGRHELSREGDWGLASRRDRRQVRPRGRRSSSFDRSESVSSDSSSSSYIPLRPSLSERLSLPKASNRGNARSRKPEPSVGRGTRGGKKNKGRGTNKNFKSDPKFTLAEDSETVERRQRRAARFVDHLQENGKRRKERLVINRDEPAEEFDLSSLHIVGTSNALQKPYLRLTSAPDPSSVRPEPVLRRALEHIRARWEADRDYHFTCEQLKSVRQDLVVQGVRNNLTLDTYETHARVAIEVRDHEEFNSCQNQLRYLYAEGLKSTQSSRMKAWRVLYNIFTKNTMEMTTALAAITADDRPDHSVKFALDVRAAWSDHNYCRLFQLYAKAQGLDKFMMDWFIDRERETAIKRIVKGLFSGTCGQELWTNIRASGRYQNQKLAVSWLSRVLAQESHEQLTQLLTNAACVLTEDGLSLDCIKTKQAFAAQA